MAGHRIVVEVEFDKENFENMIDAFKDTNPDLIEVVRCKDCKHSGNMPLGICYLHYEHDGDPVACVEPDDFCSYGERKTV